MKMSIDRTMERAGFNKYTNEYGDYIFVIVGYWETLFIAINIENNKHKTSASLKTAKSWLNKFRKAKHWMGSKE